MPDRRTGPSPSKSQPITNNRDLPITGPWGPVSLSKFQQMFIESVLFKVHFVEN